MGLAGQLGMMLVFALARTYQCIRLLSLSSTFSAVALSLISNFGCGVPGTGRSGSSRALSRIATAGRRRRQEDYSIAGTAVVFMRGAKAEMAYSAVPPNSAAQAVTPLIKPQPYGSPGKEQYPTLQSGNALRMSEKSPSLSPLNKDVHHSRLVYEGLEVQVGRVPGTVGRMVLSLQRGHDTSFSDFGGAMFFGEHACMPQFNFCSITHIDWRHGNFHDP
jgi:hypothetical protein